MGLVNSVYGLIGSNNEKKSNKYLVKFEPNFLLKYFSFGSRDIFGMKVSFISFFSVFNKSINRVN